MSRLYLWIEAQMLALRSYGLKDKPGWVVMAYDDDMADWHVLAGGDKYGMDYATGRFPDRASARRFCDYRAAEGSGFFYYVAHETSLLDCQLPEKY